MAKAKIYVVPKAGVLDPQGAAVKKALDSLGFRGIKDIRIGKFINIELDDNHTNETEKNVDEMCQKLLANEVIEDYYFEIEGD